MFYNFINKISDTKLNINTSGTGLFDKEVINRLKKINDPYPYFRGLVSELGFEIETIKFDQPLRKYGTTKNNIFKAKELPGDKQSEAGGKKTGAWGVRKTLLFAKNKKYFP